MRGSIVNPGVLMLLSALVLLAASFPAQVPSRPPDPPLTGRRIEAKDGDTIVVRANSRVKIQYRRDARIRTIYNVAQGWVVVLVDDVDPRTGTPDGVVDAQYSFYSVDGSWPLGERWEGSAVLDDYTAPDSPGGALGITTDAAFVQLLPPDSTLRSFKDARAAVITFRGNGRGGAGRVGFDQAEARAVVDTEASSRRRVTGLSRPAVSPPMPGVPPPGGPPPPEAPVRVGGNIRQPVKIADAKPVAPALAVQAGIHGVVILEIVVGPDGGVTDAKILRSIPLLDPAAVDAVRQWRYEPTLLNGRPVSVIMTVTVPFE